MPRRPARSRQVLAANLRRLRAQRGLTQRALAELASSVQPRIAELEAGRGEVLTSTLDQLAAALGLDADHLLRRPPAGE